LLGLLTKRNRIALLLTPALNAVKRPLAMNFAGRGVRSQAAPVTGFIEHLPKFGKFVGVHDPGNRVLSTSVLGRTSRRLAIQ
jgi:hypothetical protein